MKKLTIILSVLILVVGSCKNKPTTTDRLEIDLLAQTEDTIDIITMNLAPIEQEKITVLVLPPFDEIANAGISPNIQQYLETILAMDNSLNLIKFPYKKLMGVSYQQIFDKKYCKPITDKIETDIIIMSKLVCANYTGHMSSDTWNIRFRIYNTKTNKQIDSKVKGKNLRNEAVKDFILKRQNKLILEIKTIYRKIEQEITN